MAYRILDPWCGMWDLKLCHGERLVAECKLWVVASGVWFPDHGSNLSTPHSTLAIGPAESPKNLDFFFLAAPRSFLNQVLNPGPHQGKHWALTTRRPGKHLEYHLLIVKTHSFCKAQLKFCLWEDIFLTYSNRSYIIFLSPPPKFHLHCVGSSYKESLYYNHCKQNGSFKVLE